MKEFDYSAEQAYKDSIDNTPNVMMRSKVARDQEEIDSSINLKSLFANKQIKDTVQINRIVDDTIENHLYNDLPVNSEHRNNHISLAQRYNYSN